MRVLAGEEGPRTPLAVFALVSGPRGPWLGEARFVFASRNAAEAAGRGGGGGAGRGAASRGSVAGFARGKRWPLRLRHRPAELSLAAEEVSFRRESRWCCRARLVDTALGGRGCAAVRGLRRLRAVLGGIEGPVQPAHRGRLWCHRRAGESKVAGERRAGQAHVASSQEGDFPSSLRGHGRKGCRRRR